MQQQQHNTGSLAAHPTCADLVGSHGFEVDRLVEAVCRVMEALPTQRRWGPVKFLAMRDACMNDLCDKVWNQHLSAALELLGYRPKRVYVHGRGRVIWQRDLSAYGLGERSGE